jgi:hypothetical protein
LLGVGFGANIAWRAPVGGHGTDSMIARSEVGLEIRKLLQLS